MKILFVDGSAGASGDMILGALVGLGVHLFDNLGLGELAATAEELGRWEFLFMASPHAVPGGVGAALNPIEIGRAHV